MEPFERVIVHKFIYGNNYIKSRKIFFIKYYEFLCNLKLQENYKSIK
jgi:hypothetical protein